MLTSTKPRKFTYTCILKDIKGCVSVAFLKSVSI